MIGPPSAQSTRNTAFRFRSRPIAMYSLPPSVKVAIQVTELAPQVRERPFGGPLLAID